VRNGVGKVVSESGLAGKPGNYTLTIQLKDHGIPSRNVTKDFCITVQVSLSFEIVYTMKIYIKNVFIEFVIFSEQFNIVYLGF
jgi:hypothetical protein